jgi:hypothetical protein
VRKLVRESFWRWRKEVLLVCWLAPGLCITPVGAADVIISELHAFGAEDFLDQDGERSDWIEVHNQSGRAVDLLDWALTDEPAFPRRWVFPSRILGPGDALIVFASGKDRRTDELHTNFKLAARGEYLSLSRADGSVEHAYTPTYPAQRHDLSYGVRQRGARSEFVLRGQPARLFVPMDGLPGGWTEPDFADDAAGWFEAQTPFGFDSSGSYSPVLATDIQKQLQGSSSTLLARFAFNITAPETLEYLRLMLSFDDGFVVYLNGREVARSNAPDVLSAMSRANAPHDAVRVTPGEYGVLYQETFSNDTGQVQPLSYAGWSWISDLGERDPNQRAHVSTVGAGFVAAEGSVNSFPRAPDSSTGYFYAGYLSHGGPQQDALLFTEEYSLDPNVQGDLRFLWSGHSPGEPGRVAVRVNQEWFVSERAIAKEDGFASFTESFVLADERWLAVDFVADKRLRLGERASLPAGPFEAFGVFFQGLSDDASNARIKNFRVESTAAPRREILSTEIDLSAHVDVLREGKNVLAFHALNADPDDGDFFLQPGLSGGRAVNPDPPGADPVAYFSEPTPGRLNKNNGLRGLTGDTRFSINRGFYDESFQVTLSTQDGGATRILYTTDGSAPRVDDGFGILNGAVYTEPLVVSGTTTLRALAYRVDYAPSNVDTQTYVFIDDVLTQSAAERSTTWGTFPPSTSIAGTPWTIGDSVPSDWEMDPGIVDDPRYTADLIAGLTSIPSVSVVLDKEDLFGEEGIYLHPLREGIDWERPASLEYFDPNTGAEFQLNAGLRVHGGASRRPDQSRKHSFRIKFRTRYDGNGQLDFPLFREALFGSGAVESFDTLVLRANYSDGFAPGRLRWTPTNLRDQWARDAQLAVGGIAPHGMFVHLYLNGVYWGLYNLTERVDGAFGAAYYGGNKDAYDLIKDGGVDEGDDEAWVTALTLAARSITTDEAIDALAEWVDLEDLNRSMLVQLHAGNWDWPSHNWHALRARSDDGRFRFPIWDAEASMGSNGPRDAAVNVTAVSDGPARFYSRLRGSETYRLRFGDLVQRFLVGDGALSPENAAALFQARVDEIRNPIVAETARWGDHEGNGVVDESLPYTRDGDWNEEIDWLLETWFSNRSQTLLEQFRLRGLYPMLEAPRFEPHGGRIDPGTPIAVSVPLGVAYYTTDGSDPRLPNGSVSPQALRGGPSSIVRPIDDGAAVRILVPLEDLGLEWTQPGFDDSTWTAGVTGVGFEGARGLEGEITTDIAALFERANATVYLRIPFEIEAPGDLVWLNLRMKYDDGYAAYLNGVLVAARNAPEELTWDSRATRARQDARAIEFENVAVNEHLSLLRPGVNVLAIHALNSSVSSNDLLILPELIAGIRDDSRGIALEGGGQVRARAWFEGEWSALEEARFTVGTNGLRVTEIMYNPPPSPEAVAFDNDDFEYLELSNTGPTTLPMAGIRLTAGVEFVFTANAFMVEELAPGQALLLVRNLDAFATRYDVGALRVAGEYAGGLRNGGEALRLEDASGATILDFVYDDAWFPATDGEGAALEIIDPTAPAESWSEAASWRATAAFGTPGRSEPPEAGGQRIGDASQDGRVNIVDAITLLERLFSASDDALPCGGAALDGEGNRLVHDVDADGRVNLTDVIYLLDYLFRRGPGPAEGNACVAIVGCREVCDVGA